MMDIRAVIFDMDGVLIDAKEWHYESLNRALKLFGFSISRVDHLTTYDGLPTRKKLEMLSVEQGLPKYLHSFINELKQIYTMEMVNTLCFPRFSHEYALMMLKKNGIKIAVCSNSIRSTIETMMEKSNLAQYIDFIVSNQDVSRPKPDPEMYNNAINRLGLHPSECLVVEDNENGIKAARASGANVLVVNSVEEVNFENISEAIKAYSKSGEMVYG